MPDLRLRVYSKVRGSRNSLENMSSDAEKSRERFGCCEPSSLLRYFFMSLCTLCRSPGATYFSSEPAFSADMALLSRLLYKLLMVGFIECLSSILRSCAWLPRSVLPSTEKREE